MKRRPLALTIYSLVLAGAALSFPLQVIFTYEIPLHKIFQAAKYLTWLNLVVVVSMLVTSYAVAKASRLLKARRWPPAITPYCPAHVFPTRDEGSRSSHKAFKLVKFYRKPYFKLR